MFNEKPIDLKTENAILKRENADLKKKIAALEAERDKFEKKYRRLKKDL